MAAHYLVEAELAARGLEHHLLVARARDQPVDHHFLRLPDAVAARLRLRVVLRVPVRVDHDHRVRGRQVGALSMYAES